MQKKDVIEFFDRCAPTWDADMIKNDSIIEKILDNAEIGADMEILDVACGTGVMFDYYLNRGVGSVTGIDISPNMADIAKKKYAHTSKITVLCADVETYPFDRQFDRIVVYNAFPHFPEPRRLIQILSGLLKENGRLTVAHGASRETIDNHHNGTASKVSNGLLQAEQLQKIFAAHLQVEVVISNDWMYQVSGVKRVSGVHSHGDHSHSHAADASLGHTPIEELLALMRYTVSHNDAHAQELVELAQQLLQAGKASAYRQIMDAVADFDVVNAKLDALATDLEAE